MKLTSKLAFATLILGFLSCKKEKPEPPEAQQTIEVRTNEALPSSLVLKSIPGQTFVMGNSSIEGSPAQQTSNPEHEVTLSSYEIGETEITNEQFCEFLNMAYSDGVVDVITADKGIETGKKIVIGTSYSNYPNQTLYSLEGIRVLKDHNDEDLDGIAFTGSVEPENPLNTSYIGFDSEKKVFYVKDPLDINDFNWMELCDYQDYGDVGNVFDGPVLNDFENWAGAGENYSDELQGWTEENPAGGTNLPSKAEVSGWPVTFIKWYGAKAFADYYQLSLPTEAQWECAAKGGQNFKYAVHDGLDINDAVWNQLELKYALGHVLDAKQGSPNPYGLYNMGGNAWEWILDNYTDVLSASAVSNPLIEEEGSITRCWRGGSWNYHEQTLQSSIRFFDDEIKGNDHFGFRVVRN